MKQLKLVGEGYPRMSSKAKVGFNVMNEPVRGWLKQLTYISEAAIVTLELFTLLLLGIGLLLCNQVYVNADSFTIDTSLLLPDCPLRRADIWIEHLVSHLSMMLVRCCSLPVVGEGPDLHLSVCVQREKVHFLSQHLNATCSPE